MGKHKENKEITNTDTGSFNVLSIPSISSLHVEKQQKQYNTNDIYKTVLNKCIEKIIYTNRHTDKTFIIFEVPKLLIGQTTYDMKSCIHYIINNISTHGYLVQFIEPFYIYIDWGSKALKREKEIDIKKKDLLRYFPGIKEVEYVYEDVYLKQKEKDKERKDKKDKKDKKERKSKK
jgi:hypothetical protein